MVRGYRWWQSGVIYQIYPRSFMDGNGDGVGDLAGIVTRLDYLRDLGVDAVWISPFYPSPMVDFGYDITDHTGVDSLFGTLTDVDRLVREAHDRRIRVLVDFVPNHTSDEHPWFAESRSARAATRRDWYLWADPAPDGGPPNNWLSVFGGPAWTFDQRTGQYYYHAYLAEQPDLNWRNPEVRRAQYEVMRFWLERGVDGFRVDACRQLVKDTRLRDNPVNPGYRPDQPPYQRLSPEYTADRPEVASIVTELRGVLDGHARRQDPVLLGELYLPVERLVRYYGERGDGLHLPSNTHLLSVRYLAEDIAALIERYESVLPGHAWPNWVIGNHDRGRVATRLGPQLARVAAMLLLTLRGTPVLYYGDELGMTDVPVPDQLARDPYAKNVPGIGIGRDPARGPMRWADEPNAGFCPPEATPWLPVPAGGVAGVRAQRADPHSMLSLYHRLISLRRNCSALSVGRVGEVSARDGVLTYLRELDGTRALVALNVDGEDTRFPVGAAFRGGSVLLDTGLQRTDEPVGETVDLAAREGIILAQPGSGPW